MNKDVLQSEPLTEYLKGFMDEVGIPLEMIDVYREVFLFEKFHKAKSEYAAMLDFSNPGYRQAVVEQNARLIKIRKAMANTDLGKSKLEDMRKNKIGNNTTIPIPSTKF